MFKIGEVIVYGLQGVCEIERIEAKQIGKAVADYYVLKPLFNQNTAVFVPVDNSALTAKMQSVLTREQANALIEKARHIDLIKTNDENEKRAEYKNILSGGDREKIVAVIKTIRSERDARKQSGKKLNINDEQTLRKAEQLIYNELGFVFEISPEEAESMFKL